MKRLLRAALSAVATLVVLGVPAQAAPAAPTAQVGTAARDRVVSQPRNHAHIVLSKGSRVAIRMPVCLSCGYSVSLTRKPDARVARYEGSASGGSTCSGTDCVGGSEGRGFTFVATGYGQTKIRFTFRGPGSSPALSRVTYYLVVLRQARVPTNGETVVVHRGDTLYRISRAVLGSDATPRRVSALAARIYRDNHETIGRNPNVIQPRQMLLVDPTGLAPCFTTTGRLPCDG